MTWAVWLAIMNVPYIYIIHSQSEVNWRHIRQDVSCVTYTRGIPQEQSVKHTARNWVLYLARKSLLMSYHPVFSLYRKSFYVKVSFLKNKTKIRLKCSVSHLRLIVKTWRDMAFRERDREMFYLTTHSTHFIYGYMASDIWLMTILIWLLRCLPVLTALVK